jgi:MFS family permease
VTVDIAHSKTFASLSVRNYRYFWTGSFVSNVGTWMNRVAQDWLVLTILTQHSATALGIVTGLQFLPIAVLSPWAGVIADRFPKRRVLMVTQASLAASAGLLAVLVSLGIAQLWQVFVIAALTGIVSAFDAPARQAFASEMVGTDLLTNAVGLNSASFNAARLIGPGVAGLVIAWVGIAPALWINTVSFAAVILALVAMDTSKLTPAAVRRGPGAIREGLAYVRSRPDIMLILVMVFMLGTFGMNFQVTNALMATEVYGVGAEAYGMLGSIMAAGSLSAALIAARRERPRLRVLIGSLAGFAAGTFLLASSPWYWLYAVLLIPVGLAALTVMTNANAAVQVSTPAPLRGRVMALYMAIFQGGTPIGAPLIGWVGDVFGARATLYVGAIATGIAAVAAGVLLLWRYPRLRKRLRRRLRRGRPVKVPTAYETENALN